MPVWLQVIMIVFGGGIGVTLFIAGRKYGKLEQEVKSMKEIFTNHITEIKGDLKDTKILFTKKLDNLETQLINWMRKNGK